MNDLVRYSIAGLACLVVGATLVVLVRYSIAWYRAPRHGGALPRHVAEVAAGAIGLTITAGWFVYTRVDSGQPLSWATWLFLSSTVVLLLGVVDVGNLQRHRPRPELPDKGRHHKKK